jgi:hypothetical protein
VSAVFAVTYFCVFLLTLLLSAPPPPLRDLNVVLLNRYKVPDISSNIPWTLPLLRAEWVAKGLAEFTPHASWGNIRAAYDKRAYLMAHIRKKKNDDGLSLAEASEAVERDRLLLSKTVNQFWEHLKARDRSVTRRIPRAPVHRRAGPQDDPRDAVRQVQQRTNPAARTPPAAGTPPACRPPTRRPPTLQHGMPLSVQPFGSVTWETNNRGNGRRGLDDSHYFKD